MSARHLTKPHSKNFLVIFCHEQVTLKLLQALSCAEIAGRNVLRIDTSIDCDSAEYKAFAIVDGICLCIYLSVPLVWILLLYSKRSRLDPTPEDDRLAYYLREHDDTLAPMKFLYQVYRPKYFYVEALESKQISFHVFARGSSMRLKAT
jgi:hypothetical protein